MGFNSGFKGLISMFSQNETPRCIRNPVHSKYLTVYSNRTFQYIAVYLPALAVRRPSVRCTGKISTDQQQRQRASGRFTVS